MNITKKFLSLLVMLLIAALTFNVAEASAVFTDVKSDNWAYQSVADLTQKKVINGYDDGTFRPNKTISRAEIATILVKAAGLKTLSVRSSSFTDISLSDWFSPYVEAMKDSLEGYRQSDGSMTFKPELPAKREDVAVAIVKMLGLDLGTADRKYINQFTDKDQISDSNKDYIAVAIKRGIISGYPDYSFKPQGTITRAEAAYLIWKAFGDSIKTYVDETTSVQRPHVLDRIVKTTYWSNEQKTEFYAFEKTDAYKVNLTVCNNQSSSVYQTDVHLDGFDLLQLDVPYPAGTKVESYSFDENNDLIRSVGSDEKLLPSTTEAFNQCKASNEKDIHDLSDFANFFGLWVPEGEGEGGRVFVDFRNRTSGAIVFQSEEVLDKYVFGIGKGSGSSDLYITYSKEDGTDQHTAHLHLTDADHLTIEFDNGVVNDFVKGKS